MVDVEPLALAQRQLVIVTLPGEIDMANVDGVAVVPIYHSLEKALADVG
jgi:hypothetical protein